MNARKTPSHPVPATKRVGFLGPLGTFTDQAARTQSDLAACELVPYRTVPDVLDAVEAGEVDLGFVPIENSIEGMVNLTQDALVFDHDLFIQREVVLDIEHYLLALPGTALGDIREVWSMPVATAQCHAYLRKNLSQATVRAATSTAEAAKQIAEEKLAGVAAIAPLSAGEMYGLSVVERNIADHENNQTRFVLVGKDVIPPATGHDRTAIVVFQRANEPGSLISILQEFAARRIDLSHLSSRPTKNSGLGDYCFIMFADGHIDNELMADALRELRAKQGGVKFFGSYPAAGEHAHSAREHADSRWREADDWVAHLRGHIVR